jgi:hypothetical protein
MMRRIIRWAVCAAAVVALGVGSSPRVNAAAVRPVAANSQVIGNGWGSMLACAACAVGAVAIASGGPGAVAVAINTPGGAQVLLACAASCYDALAR